MLSTNQIAGSFKILYIKKEVNDELYFWHTHKHQSVLQVDTIILGVIKQAYLCNISRKNRRRKLIFWLLINAKVFYNLTISLRLCVARHAQSTQNNKFAISLHYLKGKREG